jgi:hypothetical protein
VGFEKEKGQPNGYRMAFCCAFSKDQAAAPPSLLERSFISPNEAGSAKCNL